MKFQVSFKKKIISLAVTVAIVVLTVFSAYAAFTSLSEKQNALTFGSQTIEISEDKFEISSDDIIKKDEPFNKNPTIKNTGNSPCYVRAYLNISDYNLWKKHTKININENWFLHNDGYYYYNKPLNPNESVEFFNTVTVSGVDEYKCSISIYADSIHSNNLELADAWSYYNVDISEEVV